MADKMINIGLSFSADTSKARSELEKLKNDLTKAIGTATFDSSKVTSKGLFNDAIKQAEQLRGILESATDSMGNFDLTRFTRALNSSGYSMKDVYRTLSRIGATDTFDQLTRQIANADTRTKVLEGTVKKFFQGLKNTAMWTIQSNAIHAVESALSGAYNYAQKLNKGLTDIAIVSDLNTEQLTEFAKTANQMAKDLSASTSDVVSGALIYYQAGLTDEEVIKRTETTIKLAQTSGESAEQISSYMTAIWNNFYDGSKSVEYYADAISYLGAVTAASNADIAEGMQAFSAVADTVGLSFEYGASALTLLRDITQQSASTIGNSLKTIFARLGSLKMGETLEDGVDLTKYTKALETVGVEVLDVNGELRDMDDILDDLAVNWDTLSKAQKDALAQTVGGVRQYNNLISLMDNYEKFQELVSGASGSDGYLQGQANEYAESWEAAKNRLEAAWQGIYDQIINDKFFIKLTDFLTFVVNGIGNIIEGMGGLKGVLSFIIMAVTSINPEATATGIQKIVNQVKDLKDVLTGLQKQLNELMQAEALGIYVANLDIKDDSSIYELTEQLNALIAQRTQLYSDGDKAGAAATDAAIQRTTNQINKILQLNDEIDATTGKYKNFSKAYEEVESVNASNERYNQIVSGANYGTKWQKVLMHDTLDNYSDYGLDKDSRDKIAKAIFGDEEDWRKVNKQNLQAGLQVFKEITNSDFKELRKAIGQNNIKQILTDSLEKETLKGLEGANADGENAVMEYFQKIQKQINDINWDNPQERLNTIKTILRQIYGDAENIDQKAEEINDTLDEAANQKLEQVKQKTSEWANMFSTALRGISTVMSISSSIDGISNTIKDFNKGAISGGETLTRIIGGLVSAGYGAVNMFKIFAETMKLGAAASGWLTAGIILVVAAIKGLVAWYNHETEATKEAAEKNAEISKKLKETNDSTIELTESVSKLTDEYNKLSEKGESVFDTLNNLNEQVPELIEKYKELGKILGIDLSSNILKLENAFNKGKLTGDFSDFEKELAEFETFEKITNTVNAKDNYEIAIDKMASAGHLSNGFYESGLFGIDASSALLTDVIEKSGLQNYRQGQSNLFKFDKNDIEGYYEALVKTSNALKEAGLENHTFYNSVQKEISKLSPYYEELSGAHQEWLTAVAQDIDNFGLRDEGLNNLLTSTSFEDYIDENKRQELIDGISALYDNLSQEDAEEILSKTNIVGLKEKLQKRLFDELAVVENGEVNKEATQKLVGEVAGWIDNLTSEYDKELASTLDYSKAVNGENISTEQLNAQLEKAKEGRSELRAQEIYNTAEDMNLDPERMQLYAKSVQDAALSHEALADTLVEDNEAAARLGRTMEEMQQSVDSIVDNYDDWVEVINEGNASIAEGGLASAEYYQALDEVNTAMENMLGIEPGDMDFSQDFLRSTQNLEWLKEAADGSQEALNNLREAAREDIVQQIVTDIDWKSIDYTEQQFRDVIESLQNYVDNDEIKVGANIEDEGFYKALNDMIAATGMTKNQISNLLGSMGVDATIKEVTEPIPGDTAEYFRTPTYKLDNLPYGGMLGVGGTWQYPVIDEGGEWVTETGKDKKVTHYAIEMQSATKTSGGNFNFVKSGGVTGASKGGSTRKSSGGGGSSRKTKTADSTRYHEVNAQLKQNKNALDILNQSKDRAFGQGRIDYMKQEIELLKDQAGLYERLAKEARGYYESDKARLAGYGASFNADGTIANYQSWYESYVNRYNSGGMEDEEWTAFEDAIKKYEDSLQKLHEAEKSYNDAMNKIYDERLEIVTYKVKYLNKLIDQSVDYLDYLIKQLDKDMYDTAEVIAKIGQKAGDNLEKISNIQNGIVEMLSNENHPELTSDIVEQFLNGSVTLEEVLSKIGKLTDKEVEQLQDYQDELLKLNETLIELREEAYGKIGESIEEFNDKIQRQADIVKDLDSVLNHYKNIIDIVGKDTLGISDAMLKQMSDTTLTAAKSSLDISKTLLEENQADLEELYKRRRELEAQGLEEDLRLLDQEIEAQEDRVRELTEQWASAFEDAIQAAQEVFTYRLNLATEAFEKAVSGSLGNLANLQDFYDKQNTLNDVYLPTYERIYNLSKLTRDVNNAINNTDNIKGKERLRDLQNEILKAQQEGTELSKYDVEFMQKRLELELAQIALEEAQNAKNMVRMTRDNEGNWSYTYTQNPEDVENARQNYESKLYDLEKLNQDRVKETQDLMLNLMAQYRDEIANLNVTDEERVEMLKAYWEELQTTYGALADKALADGAWITDTYSVYDHQLIDGWDETVAAAATNTATLEGFIDEFLQASQDMVTTLVGNGEDGTESVYGYFNEEVRKIMELAGHNVDNFGTEVGQVVDNIKKKLIGEDGSGGEGTAVGDAKKYANEMNKVFNDILSNLKSWFSDGYSPQIDAIKNKNESWYQSISNLIEHYHDLAEAAKEVADATGNGGGGGGPDGNTNENKGGNNPSDDEPKKPGHSHTKKIPAGEYTVISNREKKHYMRYKYEDGCSAGEAYMYSEKIDTYGYGGSKKPVMMAMASGGYTGAWGDEGKLAMLHEKELVLNKQDTENMLTTVGFVRDLVEMIGVNASSMGTGLGNLFAGAVGYNNSTLDQNVTIHAEFPNATNHSEIEEAFENLIGLAGQYAGRKQ